MDWNIPPSVIPTKVTKSSRLNQSRRPFPPKPTRRRREHHQHGVAFRSLSLSLSPQKKKKKKTKKTKKKKRGVLRSARARVAKKKESLIVVVV